MCWFPKQKQLSILKSHISSAVQLTPRSLHGECRPTGVISLQLLPPDNAFALSAGRAWLSRIMSAWPCACKAFLLEREIRVYCHVLPQHWASLPSLAVLVLSALIRYLYHDIYLLVMSGLH
jgi:hypothetical protein